jgi:hypothetical protein
MKPIALIITLASLIAVLSGIPLAQQTPTPQLSTADKIALQSLEKAKQDASKQWNDANQQELTILREWGMAHPGFRVHFDPNNGGDLKNFSIEELPKPEAAKPPAQPAPAAPAPKK